MNNSHLLGYLGSIHHVSRDRAIFYFIPVGFQLYNWHMQSAVYKEIDGHTCEMAYVDDDLALFTTTTIIRMHQHKITSPNK